MSRETLVVKFKIKIKLNNHFYIIPYGKIPFLMCLRGYLKNHCFIQEI